MGQVPQGSKILLIGDGRLATTLWSVLRERGITSARWSRRLANESPGATLRNFDATHVWLAISDRAIRGFVAENIEPFHNRTLVHFAGSLPNFTISAGSTAVAVHAAHPLTTFSMPVRSFAEIPFVLDREGPALAELLPGFTNPSYRLDAHDRAYYHALCAVAGNFSVLLWETVAARFENTLSLPAEALDVFRAQIFSNLELAPRAGHASVRASVLTGPLVRGDTETTTAHHQALFARAEMPLLKIYEAFADLYRTESRRKDTR